MRSIIIAIRYATTTETRYRETSLRIFGLEENLKEYLSTGWEKIHPFDIDKEVKHSMIRNEIENTFFNFKFLMKINKEYV